jgi:hypothetical protein
LPNKGSRNTEGVAETSLTICRLFYYLLTIPVNCNALKTLHVWENVMNFTLVCTTFIHRIQKLYVYV